MDAVIQYFNDNGSGILLLLFTVVLFVFIIDWLFKIFGWGRYKTAKPNSGFAYSIGVLLSQIIVEFRHLLALVIILMFAGALAYAMYSAGDFENRMDALQAVTSALGGLIGSIIGYYFGESAGRRSEERKNIQTSREVEQELPSSSNDDNVEQVEEIFE